MRHSLLAKKTPQRHFALRRRSFGALVSLLAWPLVGIRQAIANDWSSAAFTARRIDDALKAYGTARPALSNSVKILSDDYAERGENVRFVIYSDDPGTESLAVFAEKNRFPLAASFRFSNGALPAVALQLKLAETTDIRVVAKTADQRALSARKKVTITVSGCS